LLRVVEPAVLRGAAGETRTRELALARLTLARDRARQLRRLGRGKLLLLAPDLELGLALEQRLELLGLDRLALEEQLADRLEVAPVLLEDVDRHLVGALDDPPDLVVDLTRDLVRVVRLGAELAAEERLPVVVAEHARPELLAHAEAHHHLLGGRRDLLEVI